MPSIKNLVLHQVSNDDGEKAFVLIPDNWRGTLKSFLRFTELEIDKTYEVDELAEVKEKIAKKKAKAICCISNQSLLFLYPEMPSRARSCQDMFGSIVPFQYDKDKWIGALVLPQSRKDDDEDSIYADSAQEQAFKFYAKRLFKKCKLSKEAIKILNQQEKITLVTDASSLKKCFAKLAKEKMVAFDIETFAEGITNDALIPFKKNNQVKHICCISFGFADGIGYCLPLMKPVMKNSKRVVGVDYWNELPMIRKLIDEALQDWLFDKRFSKQIRIAHNLKFDLGWMLEKYKRNKDDCLQGKWEDTCLMAWMRDGRSGHSSLKNCGWKFLAKPDWEKVKVRRLADENLLDILTYCTKDSLTTIQLYLFFLQDKLADSRAMRFYNEVLMPVILIFTRLEHRGNPIDYDLLAKMKDDLNKRLEDINDEINKKSKGLINVPSQNNQIINYFESNGIAMLHPTSGKRSSDKETLKMIVDEADKKYAEIASKILEWRKADKLLRTYIKGILDSIPDDHKFHPNYKFNGTITGRTSCQNPNMQNFPKEKIINMRKAIMPLPKHKIVSFDFGQIEARLFATICNDENFSNKLLEDYDIHLENSKFLHGEDKAKSYRSKVKNATFSLFYGSGDASVSNLADTSLKKAKALRKKLLEDDFPTIVEWQNSMQEYVKKKGFVTSLYGRRNRLPIQWNKYLNHPMQSTASDIALCAASLLGKRYELAWFIHDDLSFYIPNDEVNEKTYRYIAKGMVSIAWKFMHHHPWLKRWVPLSVGLQIGNNWGEMQEIEMKLDSTEFGINSLEESIAVADEYIAELDGLPLKLHY